MKELSIEEKAKAYDKALERAIKLKEDPQSVFYEYSPNEGDTICDYIFPELKESEDEKIKKRIIALVNAHGQGKYKEEMLAWFEKQSEQKPQGKSALEAINEEKVDNANIVKPKFNEGEWISGNCTNYKILSVNNNGYLVEDVDGNKINILFENEKFHHLFTIADVKDGDVISYNSGWTCIFKYIHGIWYSSYCFITEDGEFHTGYEEHLVNSKIDGNANPATKEQRDLLFTKMEEAGYEWNKEKKQLKKIGQKKVMHKELTEFEKAVKQVMEEAIECGDTHNLKADADMLLSLIQKPDEKYNITGIHSKHAEGKLGEMIKNLKPAWSEEEQQIIEDAACVILDCVNTAETKKEEERLNELWNKLQDLKDRVQPQPKREWAEEDEKMLNVVHDLAWESYKTSRRLDIPTFGTIDSWLKYLKERIQSQPKQEWSEEDLYKIEHALFGTYAVDVATRLLNRIKSLRPQNTWKPSNEYINALEYFIRSLGESGYFSSYDNKMELLRLLLFDLKKLKE